MADFDTVSEVHPAVVEAEGVAVKLSPLIQSRTSKLPLIWVGALISKKREALVTASTLELTIDNLELTIGGGSSPAGTKPNSLACLGEIILTIS